MLKKLCAVFTIIILLVSSISYSNASNALEYRKNQNGETIGNDIQANSITFSKASKSNLLRPVLFSLTTRYLFRSI